MNLVHGLHVRNLRGDIFGGVTAAVVALPLALAFGVASGAGAMAGLYGAIFVGFFAALFGGTPSQISGPTGPMTVVMALIITKYAHDPAMAFTVVMMGGAFQILFGVLRFGSYVNLMPFPVISGFMSGIGCIIIILQIGPLLGVATPDGGTLGVLKHLPDIAARMHWDAAAVGIGALAVVLLMPARWGRILPAPLVALIVGTLAVLFFLPKVPVLGDIPTGLPPMHLPRFTLAALPDMIESALILALLGAIDSLLTSLIADSVTRTHHDSNRELIGQGIGNTIAGLFGGIPGAGATMRTVVNVRAGGATPISGMLHAAILLAIVLGLGPFASHIPHAVLAGILFKVGIDIVDWPYLRRVPRAPRAGVILMFLVLGLTVFVDLIVAVTVGMIAASLLFVKRMSDLQLSHVKSNHDGDGGGVTLTAADSAILARHPRDVLFFELAGALSFGGAKGLTRRIVADAGVKVLVLDLSGVLFVDTSASLALEEIIVRTQESGSAVLLVGLRPDVDKTLRRLGVLRFIATDHVFADRAAAFEHAERTVADWMPAEEYQTGHAASQSSSQS
ncbi:MAG: SulP family inorganic anion transporter [Rhodospirillales bacterium]